LLSGCFGATNLNKKFALEKTLLEIIQIGGILIVQESGKRQICDDIAI
jgi:hypothetical protein